MCAGQRSRQVEVCAGRIVGEVDGTKADTRTIGLMMANAFEKEEQTGTAHV